MVNGSIEEGRTYEIECPFVREAYTDYNEGGPFEAQTWRPGVIWEECSPEDVEAVADGLGKVLYTVVRVAELPRPYPARVFFVREWIDPNGKRFGRRCLRIMSIGAFRRRLAGYRFGGYQGGFRMREAEALVCGSPSVVTAPGPLWECRTCGEVRWFGHNERTSSENEGNG